MNDGSNNTFKIMVMVVILAVVLVGGALAVVIVNNNMQRENQAAEQAREDKAKSDKEAAEKAATALRAVHRGTCLKAADDAYWGYIKLNAVSTKQTDNGPVYSAMPEVWDTADSRKKTATDDCYRQYPN